MRIVIIMVIAFVLDYIFGDPGFLPHPICLIGNGISFFEKNIRKLIKFEFLAGMILAILVVSLSFLIPFAILYFTYQLNIYFGIAIEIYFCFQILAAKSLKKESMKVYFPIVKNDITNARKYLSYIVGRDTQNLEKDQIIKATVETIAENTTDGVTAPLIFMCIGGAPLAFMYKAVNTLDSMIGYKNEKYIRFGKFAARLDDFANFIPARVTALIMIFSSFVLRLDYKNAFKIFLRDRKNHKSPNSAQTESVCAGALNIQLAGDASYFGKIVKKPTIGDKKREIKPEDIILANKLMYVTAVCGGLFFVSIRIAIFYLSGGQR